MKNQFAAIILLFVLLQPVVSQSDYVLESPDNHLRLEITLNEAISFTVLQGGTAVVEKISPLLVFGDDIRHGINPRVKKDYRISIENELSPVVPVKSSSITERYNELLLFFKDNFALRFRAYDEGIAYRFETSYKNEILVRHEAVDIVINDDYTIWYPGEETMMSHYERNYSVCKLSDIEVNSFCSLPVLFKTPKGSSVLITESDLYDYPGLFLERSSDGLRSKFPKHVLETEPAASGGDRSEIITGEADYIARTTGQRTFPWRVFVLSDHDKDLLECNLVWQLASPLKLEKADWIKPGLVMWDWWNALNIKGVDFESGINNDTYKYYIDFAAEYGLEYVILDEGWSKTTTNIIENAVEIDVEKLVEYGRDKGVGIILWVLWKPLDRDLENVLDLYHKWGVKGIKVDFMQRSDQYMVNYYERVVREAALREILVDFHGAFKPAGLRRAYPNLVNYEGLKGMENSKWENGISPEHDVTLPFIRMVAGPMDYTPGAMDNAQEENFFPRFTRPMSQGTRCHQLAMYILYESPIQMLADNPSNYYAEEECTRFISRIPTVWDETIALEATVSDYLILARRKDNIWYIGGMTDWTARSFEIDLDFLPPGEYSFEIFEDGINAEKWASDYRKSITDKKSGDKLKIHMAKGGGWAAIIHSK